MAFVGIEELLRHAAACCRSLLKYTMRTFISIAYDKNVRSKMDEQYPFFFNNICLDLKGGSPTATQGIGRYVLNDVTDLNLLRAATEHRTARN